MVRNVTIVIAAFALAAMLWIGACGAPWIKVLSALDCQRVRDPGRKVFYRSGGSLRSVRQVW